MVRSVAEFYQECLASADQQAPIDLLLSDAVGCVLAEDVVAPFNHPGSDVAGCDGYAVRAQDVQEAAFLTPVTLTVTSEVNAGDANPVGLSAGGAARIASGAPLPVGADTVIALEDTDQGHTQVAVQVAPNRGANVRAEGEDMRAGDVIVPERTRLGPAQIAAIAAVGRARVNVHPRPRVVFISVGDELAEPGSPSRQGRVFDVNGQMLAAAASEVGAEAFRCAAVPDDRVVLRELIHDQLMRADLVVTTGGISHGSANTVRDVLSATGTVRFDQVAMNPGNILGAGTVLADGEDEDAPSTPIFCLPGDPVAAQVCFEVFVRPALRKMQGWKKLNRPSIKAAVTKGFSSPPGVRQFVRCRIQGDPRAGYEADILGRADAKWISALASSNALAVVPEDVTDVPAGTVLACMLLD